MIDGHGDPNTEPAYQQALEALYPVAYTLKFHSKRELGRDYVVPPLEGLWWATDMAAFTTARDKSQWSWTMMIMAPEWLNHEAFQLAVAHVDAKKRPERLCEVRLELLAEGDCVQTLHVGRYDDEGPILEELHQEYLPANQLRPTGKHHNMYYSDPRRTAHENLRTVLRQPVGPATSAA